MERLQLAPDRMMSKTFENWVNVRARRKPDTRPTPGNTALHEAAHVIAANDSGGIEMATIIPSGDALGITRPYKLTPYAAMAADALGYSGTSWDRHITRNVLHADPEIVNSSARSQLNKQKHFMHEVAVRLQEKKTIAQGDVDAASNTIRKTEAGIYDAEVIISFPNGNTETRDVQTERGGIVLVPGELVGLKEHKKAA